MTNPIPFDSLMELIKLVITIAMNVKANKERCERVAKRASSLQGLVFKLRERDPSQISDVVRKSLNELSATLVHARDTMRKFHNSNAGKSFIKNNCNEDKFKKINERLDDTFQVLSGALQIEQGEILNKVLQAVSEKEEASRRPAAAPFPIVFSPMPSAPPFPALPMPMPMPTPTYMQPSPLPSASPFPQPAVSPISPVTSSVPPPIIVPAITVSQPPNPPYPPAAPRLPMNPIPNTLKVPPMPMPTPCAMPPKVVTVAAPPVSVLPVMAVQNTPTIYGTLSRALGLSSPCIRTAPPVVITQAMPPKQIIVTVPAAAPVFTTNPGVTVVINRPY